MHYYLYLIKFDDGIKGCEIIDRIPSYQKSTKSKKPATRRFIIENGKLKQVKTKDHFNITKDMKIRSQKKLDKRNVQIKEAKKEMQALLKEQKKNLLIIRKQTPKTLSKIEKQIDKAEMIALREMTLERLAVEIDLRKNNIRWEICEQELVSLGTHIANIKDQMLKRLYVFSGEEHPYKDKFNI